MTLFGNGPWKEGRLGAASLCYAGLNAAQLRVVAGNHAAVGIRGTLLSVADDGLDLFRQRNWDVRIGESALPEFIASPPRPVHRGLPDLDVIARTLTTHDWTIWLMDGAGLASAGDGPHAACLRWLGDHHDRIWCAPVRDILALGRP